ncbi:MAG: TetR/AcrR family transcriptional regulator [Pseudomonadota bacterium]
MIKGQQKRALVVAKASQLFHQKGYMRVSLAEIATACEMNQGNLYYYFKTKKALAAAVLSHCDDEITGIFASMDELPPLDRLRAFFNHIEMRTENYVEWGCPIAGLSADMLLEAGAEFHRSVPKVYQTYLRWFERNLMEAGLSKSAASRESTLLLSGLQGAFHTAHLLHDATVIPIFVSEVRRRLEHIPSA